MIYRILLISTLLPLLAQCTGQLVLSQLYNSRMQVYLMGTYESNNPYAQGSLYKDDDFTNIGADITTEAGDLTTTDFKTYFDIAEIRLAKSGGLPSGGDPEDHFEFFASDRQLFCSEFSALNGKTLEGCQENNGIAKQNEFFGNGGYKYPAADVSQGIYRHVAVYFRRMVTNKSFRFDDSGNKTSTLQATFDNEDIEGTNWANLYQIAPNTNDTTLLFPLERTDLNLFAPDPEDQKKHAIEIRIFLRNLWMKHLLKTDSNGTVFYESFIGPSDWSADQDWDNTNNNRGLLGGNVLMQARIYVPDEVGSVEITGLAGGSTAGNNYMALVNDGETFSTPVSKLPLAATSISGNAATITNIPPGNYDLYRTCDARWCSGGDCTTAAANMDGYPETVSAKCADITVVTGQASPYAAGGGCDCP